MADMERPATTLSINAFTQVKAPFPPGMRMPPQFGGPERLDNPDALKEAGDPVLLVEDATETGRMLAVAARMLRRFGARGVLPLVLAVQARPMCRHREQWAGIYTTYSRKTVGGPNCSLPQPSSTGRIEVRSPHGSPVIR
jgi:hypothetical protein